jgi:exopolysaccharide production protein ExoZ
VSVPTTQLWFAAVGVPVIAATGLGRIDLSMYKVLKRWIDRADDRVRVVLCTVFLVTLIGISITTYIKWIEVCLASADSAALASRITAAMTDSHADLAAAAQSVALRPDITLHGSFDNVTRRSPTGILVQGWAADGSGGGRAVRVLVFQCGRYLGVALPQDRRPDVGAVLRIGPGRYGFNVTLPKAASCATGLDGLMVTKDGRYGLISTPASGY